MPQLGDMAVDLEIPERDLEVGRGGGGGVWWLGERGWG